MNYPPTFVGVAFGHWYPKGLDRFLATLREFEGNHRCMFFHGDKHDWIERQHQTYAYSFKLEAIKKTRESSVMWIDASMKVIHPLDSLVEYFDRKGYFFSEYPEYNLANWSSDYALKRFGITRDEAEKIPIIVSGLFGVNSTVEKCGAFLSELESLYDTFNGFWTNAGNRMSQDSRCLGHRFDQTALSFLVYKYGFETVKQPRFYSSFLDEVTDETVIVTEGM